MVRCLCLIFPCRIVCSDCSLVFSCLCFYCVCVIDFCVVSGFFLEFCFLKIFCRTSFLSVLSFFKNVVVKDILGSLCT